MKNMYKILVAMWSVCIFFYGYADFLGNDYEMLKAQDKAEKALYKAQKAQIKAQKAQNKIAGLQPRSYGQSVYRSNPVQGVYRQNLTQSVYRPNSVQVIRRVVPQNGYTQHAQSVPVQMIHQVQQRPYDSQMIICRTV